MELALEQISIEKHHGQSAHDQGTNGCCKLAEVDQTGSARLQGTFFGKEFSYWALMITSILALTLGLSSASLLGRFYFVHGGSRRWLYTWIQSAGWPVLLVPLCFCYWKRSISPTPLTPKLCLIYVVLGCLTAFDNLLYSLGLSYLPVSTNSLVCSSQLAFNAVFAYLLVGQRISPYVMNSIVVISTGTVILGVSANSDKPVGTSEKEYIMGIIVTIAASAIFALLLPLIELTYRKVVGRASFVVVMEVQIGISAVAAASSMVGMWANGDFKAMHAEAMHFDVGSHSYIMTLFWSAIGWQLCFLGGAGIIFLSSSLMSCVVMTAMIAILPILAVIFFHDNFSAFKGIAMMLSIWGFISYIYNGYTVHKTKKNSTDFQVP